MHAHGDILDRPDHVMGSFWGSIGLHASIVAAVMLYAATEAARKPLMGDVNGGGMGAVAVTAVHTIPLPSRNAQPNPLANDTKSYVPPPPPTKAKPQPERKLPNPKAIALPDKAAPIPKLAQPDRAAPSKLAQPDRPNQVYSKVGQQLSSPMYQMQGAGGIGIGNNNPLGQQYGAYARIIIDQVARHWNTSSIAQSTAPVAVISFTINRDGSVPQNSVRISRSSGIEPLDRSAQRAVLDATPFPPLPPGFPRSDAQIELQFELRR